MPQRSMRLPANTNVGTASSTQLCEPASSADGSFWSEKLPSASPTTPDTPSANTIGVESVTSATNVTTTAATMASYTIERGLDGRLRAFARGWRCEPEDGAGPGPGRPR